VNSRECVGNHHSVGLLDCGFPVAELSFLVGGLGMQTKCVVVFGIEAVIVDDDKRVY
jgi:hypothetical protein